MSSSAKPKPRAQQFPRTALQACAGWGETRSKNLHEGPSKNPHRHRQIRIDIERSANNMATYYGNL
eukprot:1429703-Heterocapsa_arctica.AAC.1